MKNEKLEITSEAIMPFLEVLRKSTATAKNNETDDSAVSTADKKIENNSISEVT